MNVCEAFVVVCEMGVAMNIAPVNTMPGCWEHQVDDHWWIAMNGHNDEMVTSKGQKVPPFHVYAERNGWPCMLFSPAGGGGFTSPTRPEGDMEREFIEAVRAATPPTN